MMAIRNMSWTEVAINGYKVVEGLSAPLGCGASAVAARSCADDVYGLFANFLFRF